MVDNPFMGSASEGGGGAAMPLMASARGAGASRASTGRSGQGVPPFNVITIPPTSHSVAPSTLSYPATPNFSEGGTSEVDPELLERLERLEMALVEEKKARANVEQRLQKIKEEEENEKSASSSTTGMGLRSGAVKSVHQTRQCKGGQVRVRTDEVVPPKVPKKSSCDKGKCASKPSSRAAPSVKRAGFR